MIIAKAKTTIERATRKLESISLPHEVKAVIEKEFKEQFIGRHYNKKCRAGIRTWDSDPQRED